MAITRSVGGSVCTVCPRAKVDDDANFIALGTFRFTIGRNRPLKSQSPSPS